MGITGVQAARRQTARADRTADCSHSRGARHRILTQDNDDVALGVPLTSRSAMT